MCIYIHTIISMWIYIYIHTYDEWVYIYIILVNCGTEPYIMESSVAICWRFLLRRIETRKGNHSFTPSFDILEVILYQFWALHLTSWFITFRPLQTLDVTSNTHRIRWGNYFPNQKIFGSSPNRAASGWGATVKLWKRKSIAPSSPAAKIKGSQTEKLALRILPKKTCQFGFN